MQPRRDVEGSAVRTPLATSRAASPPADTSGKSAADDLRAALADAIRARAWRAVEIIQEQIDAGERPGVVSLAEERKRRGR